MSERRLHAVASDLPPAPDPDTGELIAPDDPMYRYAVTIRSLRDELAGAERALRSESRRLEELKRDRQREAEADPLWPLAKRLFEFWQHTCNHPSCEWTHERFELARPYIVRRKYGPKMCARAIAGAAFDPFTTTRKNGSSQRHDGWELIFRDPGKFESFVNRAPTDFKVPENLR